MAGRSRVAARRLAQVMAAADAKTSYRRRNGTIASVTAGAAADGHAAVSVTVDGNTIAAPYLASYTPTVGDLVAVELIGGSPLILGKAIGLPVI